MNTSMKDYICPCGLTEKRNRPPKKSGYHGKIALSGFQLHMLVIHLRYSKKEALGLKTDLYFRQPRDTFHLKINNLIMAQMEAQQSHILARVRLPSKPYERNPFVNAMLSRMGSKKSGDSNHETDEVDNEKDNEEILTPPSTPKFENGCYYGVPKLEKTETEDEVKKRLLEAGMNLNEFNQ